MQETTRRSGSIFGEPSGGASRAQRGPRFGRNIIDLESESEAEERPRHSSHAAASHTQRPNYLTLFPPRAPSTTNPHPRFAGLRRPQRAPPFETDMDDLNPGRSRSNARIRLNGDSARGHRSVTPYPNGFAEPIDLTGDDDDVVFVETRAGVNADRPTATAGAGTRSMTDRLNDIRAMTGGGRLFHHLHNLQHALGAFARDTHDPIPHMPAAGPLAIGLEFDLPAFDMGIAGGNQTTADKYEPPAAASRGFTRTPAEDDVLVCPNCGDELAVSEDEKKQEVWVIKKCGHVSWKSCFSGFTVLTIYRRTAEPALSIARRRREEKERPRRTACHYRSGNAWSTGATRKLAQKLCFTCFWAVSCTFATIASTFQLPSGKVSSRARLRGYA